MIISINLYHIRNKKNPVEPNMKLKAARGGRYIFWRNYWKHWENLNLYGGYKSINCPYYIYMVIMLNVDAK